MAVLHPAVLADPQALAVLGKLPMALLFRLARLEAFCRTEVRFRHAAVVGDVLPDFLGAMWFVQASDASVADANLSVRATVPIAAPR
jgi:hypothetical protein